MLLYAVFACATPVDSGDTAADSADTGDAPELAPTLTVRGDPSAAAGRAMDFASPLSGEPGAALWVAGYFVHRLCRFSGVQGEVALSEAPVCIGSTQRDSLGFTVAAGPDTVAAGAIGGKQNGAYAGAVYLFPLDLAEGTHDETAALTVLHGEATNDYAGTAVDWLAGAGGASLVIGAPGSDGNGPGSGRAYLFGPPLATGEVELADAPTIIEGTTPEAAVRHGDPEAGDGVGQVMASAGDLDGDGDEELAIGCIGADDGGSNAGLVAVFSSPLPAGVLALRDADVVITGEADDQYVGDYVVGLGDADGDGLGDLALSGETLDREGRVWVFASPVGSGTVAGAAAQLVGEAVLDQAGAHLAAAGDTDGDGLGDLVVGAYGHDTNGVDAGAAYLVHRPAAAGVATLGEVGLRWLGEAEGDYGGRVVAGGGDYDGDGLADLIFGAPYSDAGGAFAGSAYVVPGR